MSKKFSHLDDDNNPSMVDISSKLESKRIAKAYAKVILNNEILNLISVFFCGIASFTVEF